MNWTLRYSPSFSMMTRMNNTGSRCLCLLSPLWFSLPIPTLFHPLIKWIRTWHLLWVRQINSSKWASLLILDYVEEWHLSRNQHVLCRLIRRLEIIVGITSVRWGKGSCRIGHTWPVLFNLTSPISHQMVSILLMVLWPLPLLFLLNNCSTK